MPKLDWDDVSEILNTADFNCDSDGIYDDLIAISLMSIYGLSFDEVMNLRWEDVEPVNISDRTKDFSLIIHLKDGRTVDIFDKASGRWVAAALVYAAHMFLADMFNGKVPDPFRFGYADLYPSLESRNDFPNYIEYIRHATPHNYVIFKSKNDLRKDLKSEYRLVPKMLRMFYKENPEYDLDYLDSELPRGNDEQPKAAS